MSSPAQRVAWLILIVLVPGMVHGEVWFLGVVPGRSDKGQIRALFGQPSRQVGKKEEGYDTSEWHYEGTRAPVGATRMVIQFGLLAGQTFRPEVVRALTYFPRPNIFPAQMVVEGWGVPDRRGTDPEGRVVFFYRRGLIVKLDRDGRETLEMLFTVQQPE